MSVLLFKEEKSDFSGGKKIRRKKSLQVQLHTKRTEVNEDLEIFILLLSVVSSLQTVHYKLVQGLKCHIHKYFFFFLHFPLPFLLLLFLKKAELETPEEYEFFLPFFSIKSVFLLPFSLKYFCCRNNDPRHSLACGSITSNLASILLFLWPSPLCLYLKSPCTFLL